MKLANIKVENLMIGILITYIPFHLFEEALGNFPAWMQQHQWMAHRLTYGHWMAGNIFFYYPLLFAGVLLYQAKGEKYLFTGVGVLFWGLLNFLEHSIYSVIDFKISPGLFTSFLLAFIAIVGFFKLFQMEKLSVKLMISSFIFALLDRKSVV